MPPNTIKVDRSTKWGNHWRVWYDGFREEWNVSWHSCHHVVVDKPTGVKLAVQLFREDVTSRRARTAVHTSPNITDIIKGLRGKNVGCWCKLPAPGEPDICHGAVLLEIANGPIG